jgi:hypothetical protein
MKTCEKCGKTFKPRQTGRPNRFCSMACYNASGRPDRKVATKGQRMRRVPGHPLAPPSGTVAECRLVLYAKIGNGPHACHWCDKAVTWMPGATNHPDALVADHLDWDKHNNVPENLVPSCRVCNAHRTRDGDRRLIQEGELIATAPNGSRHRAVHHACEVCGHTFIAKIAQVRIGKGRFCSRSCARRVGVRKKQAR